MQTSSHRSRMSSLVALSPSPIIRISSRCDPRISLHLVRPMAPSNICLIVRFLHRLIGPGMAGGGKRRIIIGWRPDKYANHNMRLFITSHRPLPSSYLITSSFLWSVAISSSIGNFSVIRHSEEFPLGGSLQSTEFRLNWTALVVLPHHVHVIAGPRPI